MDTVTVGMLAFAEMQLLDFIGPYDFFTSAPEIDAIVIGPTAQTFEVGAGMSITPHYGAVDAPAVDVLFVPGGTGINDLLVDDCILDYLARAGERAQFVTSVCTGSLVLGAAGLLRGYHAATHWRYMDLLPLVGAEPVDERVVSDGNRITAGGVTAGIDFALVVLAALRGEATAKSRNSCCNTTLHRRVTRAILDRPTQRQSPTIVKKLPRTMKDANA
jgi:cyclohexyl-isocyanide hydratase